MTLIYDAAMIAALFPGAEPFDLSEPAPLRRHWSEMQTKEQAQAAIAAAEAKRAMRAAKRLKRKP